MMIYGIQIGKKKNNGNVCVWNVYPHFEVLLSGKFCEGFRKNRSTYFEFDGLEVQRLKIDKIFLW